MNVDDAILAHSKWKHRLTDYIDGTSAESLAVSVVERDDVCALGVWLRGEAGAALVNDPAIKTLRADHAAFHRCAASIVRTSDAGDRAKARLLIAFGSEYSVISGKLVKQLAALRGRLG